MMKRTITLTLLVLGTTAASAQQVGTPGSAAQARAALDDLVGRLEQHQGKDQDVDLSIELRALLKGNPELVPEIPRMLVRDKPSLDTSGTMILALEVIGSPKAQRALEEIHADRGQRHMDRLRAVMAAGAVKEPTSSAISGLWSAAGQRSDGLDVDVSNTAILSLGVAGSKLRTAKPAEYTELRGGLVASLHDSPATDERSMFLKGIGNLHDPSLGEDVATYLYDESAPVRASAAQSLGLMGHAASRPVLVQLLEHEPRGVVRAEVVSTLRELPADVVALRTVHAAILDEPHPEARAQMVSYLVEHLAVFEEARPTLQHVFHNDPTQRIRVIAAAAMRP